ncbi:IclR family transcriptional regulator [Halalkalibacterium halodurans]|jgi:DNA-binding IclR family transcriptional regulator|uniref:IclR family transcriptional regulator n=1 Tax=Halalkalibacterium halodurans TaxID=86665 RepID=A0A0M0KKA8_ALKHA|nr:IclR family transcriptional regulator [Halalkalibacterium halodurans]TPE70936.1 IclR family transcriptional regulator [Halalkalibacterium halodurans]
MQEKNKTVIKSMNLLNLFRTYPTLTLQEMVKQSGMPKTSVHRMINSLEEMGFLQKRHDGAYELGVVFLELGQLVSDRLDLRQVAFPIMEALRNQVEEAVHLTVRDGDEAIYIEKLDTLHPVRLFTKVGRRAPLYAGACQRVILSFLPEQEQTAYLERVELVPLADGTITDKLLLKERISETQQTGVAISHSELENNTTAIAAPIYDHSGTIVAGISIAGPDIRVTEERLPMLKVTLKNAAKSISKQLGWLAT